MPSGHRKEEKMKINKFAFVFSVVFAVLAAVSSFAQGDAFTDPNVDYGFDLPDAKWKMTVKPSATSPNVEYVYGYRTEGHLEVRKLSVAKNVLLSDVIKEEEQKLQFRPGYVAGKEENFVGRLRGSVFNFEFVAAAKGMAGRFYFLRANETTIYVLRFAGLKDTLRSIENQTDSIARTFKVKQGA
jgi:hypothetical protein